LSKPAGCLFKLDLSAVEPHNAWVKGTDRFLRIGLIDYHVKGRGRTLLSAGSRRCWGRASHDHNCEGTTTIDATAAANTHGGSSLALGMLAASTADSACTDVCLDRIPGWLFLPASALDDAVRDRYVSLVVSPLARPPSFALLSDPVN
jgi:hypothetical protein